MIQFQPPSLSAPIETAERIEAAARLIAAGQTTEAERFLREILKHEPGNPDALNTFATLALARGDGAGAFEILGPACTAYPDHPRLLANLGLTHVMLGRLDDAIACLERAVGLAPEDTALRLALAQYRAAAGDFVPAIAAIESVLRLAPGDAKALIQLGLTALAAGDPAKGEAALRQAAAADPGNADALGALSRLLSRTGRHEEAALLAERAYLRAPLDLDRQLHFARARAMLGDFEAAAALCRRILAVAPAHVPANEVFARIAIARGTVDAGLGSLTQVVRSQPQNPDAILALAGVLRFAGRMAPALAFVDQALALAPDHPHGLELRRDLLLTLGRFGQAWPQPEAPDRRASLIRVPRGMPATDVILFGRFIADLEGEEVAILPGAEAGITDLLHHLHGVTQVQRPHPGESIIDLTNLPALLGIGRDTIATPRPLPLPDPLRVKRWRAALAPLPRPLLGVAWDQFAPGLLAQDLLPIVAAAGTPVSVATGPERHQLRDWPQVIDAGRHIASAADLIAALSCLDGFVGTDGVPLHLAGALGLRGVAMAAAGYAWPLTPEGEHLLWHPMLRRIAQSAVGDWAEALAALGTLLPELGRAAPTSASRAS